MSSRPSWFWPLLVGLGALGVGAAAWGGVSHSRKSDAARDRALLANDLAAFQRCLIGDPLGSQETLAGRVRGIEVATSLDGDTDDTTLGEGGSGPAGPQTLDSGHHWVPRSDAKNDSDAGVDGGPPPLPPEQRWPVRCAPFADTVRARLRSEALSRDTSLDALRDAFPSHDRMLLSYALTPDEAGDLAQAIEAAKLEKPKTDSDNQTAPTAVAPPLSARDLKPISLGKLETQNSELATTDLLETSALHILVHSEKGRLCTLRADDPRGAYATARCSPLPDWMSTGKEAILHLANTEEGAPTSLIAHGKAGADGVGGYGLVMVLGGATKVLPMSTPPDLFATFVSRSGAYMVAGNYGSLVRVGSADKVSTMLPTDRGADTTGVKALHADTRSAVAAYGAMFFTDGEPVYASDPTRRMRARVVQPELAPKEIDLGAARSDGLWLLGGCQVKNQSTLVFKNDIEREDKFPSARVVMFEQPGDYKVFETEVGDGSSPRLSCLKDGTSAVTSLGKSDREHAVVIEDRCSLSGCVTKKSDPIAVWAGDELDAATLEGGAFLVWKIKSDHVLSKAKGMAFFRMAPLDQLAKAPPHPLIENHRAGGFDVDHVHLLTRPAAAIVALQTGGTTPSTYAVRIDETGTVSPVLVEETQW